MSCLKGELNRLTQLLDTPSVELCPISVPWGSLGLWLYQIKTMLEVFLILIYVLKRHNLIDLSVLPPFSDEWSPIYLYKYFKEILSFSVLNKVDVALFILVNFYSRPLRKHKYVYFIIWIETIH
jgi:hypothetical protein